MRAIAIRTTIMYNTSYHECRLYKGRELCMYLIGGIYMMINNNFNVGALGGQPWWASTGRGTAGGLGSMGNLGIPQGANMASTSALFREGFLDVRSTADAMRGAMRSIMGFGSSGASPFGNNMVTPDNADTLTVTAANGNLLNQLRIESFDVEVLQLATAQRNEGTAMATNANAVASGFSAGQNQMTLQADGRNISISFNISATDTVRDVQQRMATAINQANAGVTASVSQEGGNSTLVLQSAQTGVENAGQPNFTISGAAAQAAGVTQVTQAAQNAEFRVNRGFEGVVQSSRTNDVDLGFGVQATLRQAGTTTLSTGRDELGQINAMRQLANVFNDMMEVAHDNRGTGRNAGRLERDLRSFASANASGLARIGITINASGFMDINEDRMRAAAASGELERFALPGGPRSESGFVARLERLAGNMGQNAANYVATPTNPGLGNMGNMFNRQMNQWMAVGMLFDAWF